MEVGRAAQTEVLRGGDPPDRPRGDRGAHRDRTACATGVGGQDADRAAELTKLAQSELSKSSVVKTTWSPPFAGSSRASAVGLKSAPSSATPASPCATFEHRGRRRHVRGCFVAARTLPPGRRAAGATGWRLCKVRDAGRASGGGPLQIGATDLPAHLGTTTARSDAASASPHKTTR